MLEANISNREVISEPFVPKRQGGWSPCGRGQSLDRINAIKIDEDTKIKTTSSKNNNLLYFQTQGPLSRPQVRVGGRLNNSQVVR